MKKILLLLIMGIFLFSFASALDSQGTFKQGDCMNISQTCASCSYVNISSVSNQNNSNLVSNVEMVSFGNGEWRYEFCDTNFIGRYDVKGHGDSDGTDTSFATYFEITPSGEELTQEKSLLLIAALIILLTLIVLTIRGMVMVDNFGWNFGFLNIAYLLFNIFFFVGWKIFSLFITTIPSIGTALHSLWIVSNIVWIPFILGQVAFLLLKATDEAHITSLMKKGYTQDEAQTRVKRKK